MLIRANNEIAIIMKDKEVLVRANPFSKLLIFQGLKYQPQQETAHLSITKKDVSKTILC